MGSRIPSSVPDFLESMYQVRDSKVNGELLPKLGGARGLETGAAISSYPLLQAVLFQAAQNMLGRASHFPAVANSSLFSEFIGP